MVMNRIGLWLAGGLIAVSVFVAACSSSDSTSPSGSAGGTAPTADEARRFLDNVNQTMLRLGVEQGTAGWAYSTNINPTTEAENARTNQAYIEAVAKFAKDATRF